MDNIFLAVSDTVTLEKMFNVIPKNLLCWGLQISHEKIQRGDFLNYLGFKVSKQKFNCKRYRLEKSLITH